jgi:hypothetical protein
MEKQPVNKKFWKGIKWGCAIEIAVAIIIFIIYLLLSGCAMQQTDRFHPRYLQDTRQSVGLERDCYPRMKYCEAVMKWLAQHDSAIIRVGVEYGHTDDSEITHVQAWADIETNTGMQRIWLDADTPRMPDVVVVDRHSFVGDTELTTTYEMKE